MFNRQEGGAARQPGFKLLPKHLQGNGLMQHPFMKNIYKRDPNYVLEAPCGLLAILLSLNYKHYQFDFEKWIVDANFYKDMMGIESLYMRNGDFEKLMCLDGFIDKRLVIFRRDGGIEYSICGEEWDWPEELLRTDPDPNSLYLMRDESDSGEKHYWCVGTIKQLCNPKGNAVLCYFCFKNFKDGPAFDGHPCHGLINYQCHICKRNFISADSLNDHRSKEKIDHCDCCGRKKFYGEQCYERHSIENCNPPKGFNKSTCDDCKRHYKTGEIHNCDIFKNPCYNCKEPFKDLADYRNHRCYLQIEEDFWDPTPDGKFNCHFAYDFETCREEETEEDQTVFKHEIMAWCVQLMIPDDELKLTKSYIEEKKFRETVIEKIEKCCWKRDIHPQLIGNTIRIQGTCIESFVCLVTEILVQTKRGNRWCPTFWAHNGSRFDAKFLLDYFLNVKNYDLSAPTFEDENNITVRGGESKRTKVQASKKRTKFVSVAMIGSKVLKLKVDGAVFCCSYAHLTEPLRKLPKTFGLSVGVKKGEFPYSRLKRENWGKKLSFPILEEFEIDFMSKSRRKEVKDWWDKEDKSKPWDFDKELWEYLYSDVDVLCKALEAYHLQALEMHKKIWITNSNSDYHEKLISPLQVSTAPSWAFKMYQIWFMPENRLIVLTPREAKVVRESLRGGRTDKRANYIELEDPNDQIQYVDFKSLYPSVQKCSIHNTHFPVGRPSWGRFNGPSDNEKLKRDMGDKTGFIRISCKPKKYVTHPTLHRVGKYSEEEFGNKLLFELDPKAMEVYAWPEIEEAIRCDEIEVTHVHEALLFDKGTDVFDKYVDFFFDIKEENNTGNPGLRALAKLLLNSLWGKLGQRSYSSREWVTDTITRDNLLYKFESGEYLMKNCILKDDHRAYFEYSKPDDFNNLKTTACHIAAFVSMWGRVTLHRKLLSYHGMRALYCDTDSAIVYLRGGIDEMKYLGDKLGDLTDELEKLAPGDFKEPFISRVVMVAPKTYGLEIKDKTNADKVYEKIVCKGFEPSYANEQSINFKNFRELVYEFYKLNEWMSKKRPREHVPAERRLTIRTEPNTRFISSMSQNKITPMETKVQKNLNGRYTKGQVHPNDPRFIASFSKMKMLPSPGTFLSERDKHFE
jgi:DNA polymerase type B, organellar and viral